VKQEGHEVFHEPFPDRKILLLAHPTLWPLRKIAAIAASMGENRDSSSSSYRPTDLMRFLTHGESGEAIRNAVSEPVL
jgi:hypothetical protein